MEPEEELQCDAEYCRIWTSKKKEEDMVLKQFEVWLQRTMIKVKWIDRIRNEDMLARVGEEIGVT